MDDVVQIAVDARVTLLAFFHHDPSHSDEKNDVMVVRGRDRVRVHGVPLDCFAAQVGMVIEL
ncbi:MAG: hypothetical protein COS85_22490 [Armatimonadetes bacterium CG07_land_8_20_14_0_80_59_28]|nr:MAG: hypothetical protein COS85_22490 [Armatimonadetes bacterium CG07_land_8_20_14_0_80_59_28]PIY37597.1 MAG: hypothetical protein COZ05_22255 [Armatimonadetes bacterium CG_4_10_14_3_um_filter_59_10]PJB72311.1 MAG: hypothetical protein CO095_07060 [Armatimonadetes bacterium CG_4_9_14_3_um_filter_58_7]